MQGKFLSLPRPDMVPRREGGAEGTGSKTTDSGSDTGIPTPPSQTFFRGVTVEELHAGQPMRQFAKRLLENDFVETSIGCVIVLDFALVCIDTDARVQNEHNSVLVIFILMSLCLLCFILEMGLRLFVDRIDALRSRWNLLDLVVIAVGIVEFVMHIAHVDFFHGWGILKSFGTLRLLRLLACMKCLAPLRELRKLVLMIFSCFTVLFYSVLLLLLLMTFWSVLAVQILHPLMEELTADGAWPECDQVCRLSFSTVFRANVYWFSTIVAGDSWGRVAVPIIHRSPGTLIIFLGSFMTVVFGVLNSIVAVIVDTYAEERANNVEDRAKEMEHQELRDKKALSRIFRRIDEDQSGAVSYQELEDGARKVPEFRQRLRVMDIDEHDLRQLFQMLDEDGSGEIDPEEFIEILYRMQHTEVKTATKFVKHSVTMIRRMQAESRLVLEEKIEHLQAMLQRCEACIRDVVHGSPSTVATLKDSRQLLADDAPMLKAPHAGDLSRLCCDSVQETIKQALQEAVQSAMVQTVQTTRKSLKDLVDKEVLRDGLGNGLFECLRPSRPSEGGDGCGRDVLDELGELAEEDPGDVKKVRVALYGIRMPPGGREWGGPAPTVLLAAGPKACAAAAAAAAATASSHRGEVAQPPDRPASHTKVSEADGGSVEASAHARAVL